MDDIILKEAEYREQIAKLTNEIGLPALILKPVIKELYEQLNMLENQQYKDALNRETNKAEGEEEQIND